MRETRIAGTHAAASVHDRTLINTVTHQFVFDSWPLRYLPRAIDYPHSRLSNTNACILEFIIMGKEKGDRTTYEQWPRVGA